MNRHEVEVTILGADVSPEQVAIRDLVEVLSRIERAVLCFAEETLEALPEGAMLSLVALRRGSEQLVFSVHEPLVPAMAKISEVVSTSHFSELPTKTYGALYELSESMSKRGWSLEIREDPRHSIHNARLGAENALQPPYQPAFVRGTTTLHGECLRVGGATGPKAEIRLSTTDRILNVELSQELAKELAPRLYEDVALVGQATWNTETWEITHFRVSEITDYRMTDPAEAFQELARAAEGHWDDVDAVSYVHGLRDDE